MLIFEKHNFFEIEVHPSLQNPEPKENQGTQEVNSCGVKCHTRKPGFLTFRDSQTNQKAEERYPNHQLNPI